MEGFGFYYEWFWDGDDSNFFVYCDKEGLDDVCKTIILILNTW